MQSICTYNHNYFFTISNYPKVCESILFHVKNNGKSITQGVGLFKVPGKSITYFVNDFFSLYNNKKQVGIMIGNKQHMTDNKKMFIYQYTVDRQSLKKFNFFHLDVS